MRYGEGHSEKTKNRVVKIAAAQMRKRGPDNVGVADVMSRAGLTHGGFYAHFESKDDLIAAAIGRMFEESRARFREWTEGKDQPGALRAYINAYVSKAHRDKPESGCAIAALSSDIGRQGSKARAAYDAGIMGLANSIGTLLPIEDAAKRRALALSMLAEMTGAVAAARAVSDQTLSEEILSSARRSLRARAGLPELKH
ncbi:MAG: TetR/AcrR family transcriptional regulator [Alphaproteobacteria bacterium]|nr:TetR/AcrR family transcriptional regulator [Alphaproteobacteria bacterium]